MRITATIAASAAIAACFALAAFPAQAAHYYTNGWIADNGVIYHQPVYMPTRSAQPVSPNVLRPLRYGGGIVQEVPHIYVTFWGWKKAGDPNRVKPYLLRYLRGVGGTSWLNTVSQYTDTNGPIQNNPNQLVATWNDDVNKIPAHPSNAQVAAEAVKAVAQFGYDEFGTYYIATATGHDTPGFGTQFCAYHTAAMSGSNAVSFINFPYTPDGGTNCGKNVVNPGPRGGNDGVALVAGHELAEVQTDPLPFTGWNSTDGELADMCGWVNLQNTVFSTGKFPTQTLYSNATQTCVQHYP